MEDDKEERLASSNDALPNGHIDTSDVSRTPLTDKEDLIGR